MLNPVADQRDVVLTQMQQQEIIALLSQTNGKAVYLYKRVMESGEMPIVLIPSDFAMQEVMQMLNSSIAVLNATNEQVSAEAQETVRVIKEDCQRTIKEQAQTITELRGRIAQLEGLQAQMTTTYQEKLQAITDAEEQRKNALEISIKNANKTIESKIDGLIQQADKMLTPTNTQIAKWGIPRATTQGVGQMSPIEYYKMIQASLVAAKNELVRLKAEVNN